jgi:hypothetical protein
MSIIMYCASTESWWEREGRRKGEGGRGKGKGERGKGKGEVEGKEEGRGKRKREKGEKGERGKGRKEEEGEGGEKEERVVVSNLLALSWTQIRYKKKLFLAPRVSPR